jgi:hypothetical protein
LKVQDLIRRFVLVRIYLLALHIPFIETHPVITNLTDNQQKSLSEYKFPESMNPVDLKDLSQHAKSLETIENEISVLRDRNFPGGKHR